MYRFFNIYDLLSKVIDTLIYSYFKLTKYINILFLSNIS